MGKKKQKQIANKDKHSYELLSGERVSLGWLNPTDMTFLEGLKAAVESGHDYFELLMGVRGKKAYPFKGAAKLTPEIARSVLYRVAEDIVERAGIQQGHSIAPGSGPADPDEKPLVSLSEAAEIIGITRAGVHLALTKGRLKGWQVGKVWVLDKRSVQRYRDRRSESASAPAPA